MRMDYAILTETAEEEAAARSADGLDDGEKSDERKSDQVDEDESKSGNASLTMLVMHESQNTSVWAYPVEKKGATEEWVTAQLVEDFETIGLRDERIILKSDQGFDICEVKKAVRL